MRRTLRQQGEIGQIAILLAVAMVGLLAIVGLALDGGMLFWNQRRAQNGADAAAIAGTSALLNSLLAKGYSCGTVNGDGILTQVYLYASNNEVPNAAGGNAKAYYLTLDGSGNRKDLINPSTNQPWEVKGTEPIPCKLIVGIHVKTSFPQDTFLAGLIGIAKTNVSADAYAIYERRDWCSNYLIYGLSTEKDMDVVALIGSSTRLTGGVHSNGGIHIGGGGQGIYFYPDGLSIEYNPDGQSQIGYDKITGNPDIETVPPYPLPDDFFYSFDDFKGPNGFIYQEVVKDGIPYYPFTKDIKISDVRNNDGTLKDGLYVTTGSIDLNQLKVEGTWHATLVAKGSVQISGGFNQVPVARGVFIYTESDDKNNGAVKLSGSGNSWAGTIVAPNGTVNLSSASNSSLSGMIIGWEVDLSGSNLNLNHNASYCPINPPRILLIR